MQLLHISKQVVMLSMSSPHQKCYLGKHGWIVRVSKLIDTIKEETSSRTHRSAFTLLFTDLVTCCFYEASVSSLVKVIWAAKPLLTHVQRVHVRETIEGSRSFFRPVDLLRCVLKAACPKNVTVTSDRWKATPHDITLQGSLFHRNPTHPQRWQGMPTVMEPRVEEGAFVSIYPHLARDLLSRYPPQSSSSLLCLCQLKPHDILYSLHFWPTL